MPSAMPPSSRAAPPNTQQGRLAGLIPSGMPWAKVGPQFWALCHMFFLGDRSCVQGARKSVWERLRDEAAQPGTPGAGTLPAFSGAVPGSSLPWVCWASLSACTMAANNRKPLLSTYCVWGWA